MFSWFKRIDQPHMGMKMTLPNWHQWGILDNMLKHDLVNRWERMKVFFAVNFKRLFK